tara:strand:- start:238 stop:1008 length:771 start_codon:yes stop_codon:yes gene_type:complete
MISWEKKNSIGIITLNRPKAFNSFIKEMAISMQSKLDTCKNDDGIRCVVITGHGKAFCAGQDLNEAINPNGPQIEEIVTKHYNPIIKKIREIEKPVLAAVNGVAAGAGANLALSCDLVVATKSANFIQAFSKIGLVPDSGGTFFLPRLIGFPKATALMMTGEKVMAEDAEKMGMIYKVFEDNDFNNMAIMLAEKLAAMPTKGLGLIKKLLNESLNSDLDTQLDLEGKMQVLASKTDDHKEGVQAFLEKRKPKFSGK